MDELNEARTRCAALISLQKKSRPMDFTKRTKPKLVIMPRTSSERVVSTYRSSSRRSKMMHANSASLTVILFY